MRIVHWRGNAFPFAQVRCDKCSSMLVQNGGKRGQTWSFRAVCFPAHIPRPLRSQNGGLEAEIGRVRKTTALFGWSLTHTIWPPCARDIVIPFGVIGFYRYFWYLIRLSAALVYRPIPPPDKPTYIASEDVTM